LTTNEVQAQARYTIHVKYWGHVCNAVVKSLALGTPVINGSGDFSIKEGIGLISGMARNGLVFKTKDDIVAYLNGESENATWLGLKKQCVAEAKQWHFPTLKKKKMD